MDSHIQLDYPPLILYRLGGFFLNLSRDYSGKPAKLILFGSHIASLN
jgi:hypothetical protein